MIIINEPFVSNLLKETIAQMQIPVLKNDFAKQLKQNFNFIDDPEAVEKIKTGEITNIYSNSENCINWINNNIEFSELPEKIKLFKNKYEFRKMLKPIYPDFYFKKITIDEIETLDISSIRLPFIIKPAVGFFSMGIYTVTNEKEWEETKILLKEELKTIKGLYPEEVMDGSLFLIEDIIEGEEFAVDAYYNNNKKPVILNIYKHIFSSSIDVSDRAYFTSKTIIEKYHDDFLKLLNEIGELAKLRNFPMHIELRINKQGKAIPIESNPLRFAGWCMTDMAYYAYGINPYDYFFNQKQPDWENILKDKVGKQYNVTVANISKDIKLNNIESVNYEAFTKDFKNPLELRKMDYKTYPLFAFMFSETKEDDSKEFNYFLKSDLKKYIVMKSE